ncbi:hypothetical protein P0D72_26540 [Paraburkholderia sediminicola]|uniref:hypothetical protein n=1 Tax=Paraburkholderia sediminicola TaxID=458836 RepID=UPI0038BB9703
MKLVPPLIMEMESIPYGRHIKMNFLIKNENPYDIVLSLIYRTSAELQELYALENNQKKVGLQIFPAGIPGHIFISVNQEKRLIILFVDRRSNKSACGSWLE